MTDRITVLIVDDHAVVRQGVRTFLQTQADIEVIGASASGEESLREVETHAPDIVLMDLAMPGLDGVEATRRLKKISPRTQVIVLTSYHEDAHIFPALRAGALSYLLKDVGPRELADAIRMAARGEAMLHPRVAARVVQELRGEPHAEPNAFIDLTEREFEVLGLVAEGLDNASIAERLSISEKTVKSHVSNILSKLQLADRTQAAVFAWREGIVRRQTT